MLLSSGIGFIVYTSFQHGRTREHPTKSFDRVGYIGTWIEATQSAQVLMSQTNLTCEFVVNGLTYIILLYIILLTYIIYIVNKFALLAWFLSLLTYNKKNCCQNKMFNNNFPSSHIWVSTVWPRGTSTQTSCVHGFRSWRNLPFELSDMYMKAAWASVVSS